MKGHEALAAARMRGWNPGTVRILVEPTTGAWWRQPEIYRMPNKATVAEIQVDPEDVAGALDLRCCRGLPVFVHADSYDAGKAVLFRVAEFEPALAALVAPDSVVRMTDEGVEQWDL